MTQACAWKTFGKDRKRGIAEGRLWPFGQRLQAPARGRKRISSEPAWMRNLRSGAKAIIR